MPDIKRLARAFDQARRGLTPVPILDGATCIGKYIEDGDDVLVFVSPVHDRVVEVHVAPDRGGPMWFDYVTFAERDGKRWIDHFQGFAGDQAHDDLVDSIIV